ncbi:MAG: calcium/sodium antiporter [Methanobrevibacter sp.]|nr:calcium/sodium antiporter [Methanobrevibacter sp.]
MLEILEVSFIALFIIALLIVIKAADIFVDNVLKVGTALGVSQVLLGITAVAMGTSLPEYGSALISSLNSAEGMGVGLVIGSNIWNLAGILGISAVITGYIKADEKFIKRDGLMAVIVGIILFIVMIAVFISGADIISKIGSVIMILVFFYYLRVLIKDQKKEIKDLEYIEEKTYKNKEPIEIDSNTPKLKEVVEKKKKPLHKKNILYLTVGLIGIIIGCQLLVYSAEGLADIFNIPQIIMGLFLLSITTSFPELAITVTSAMKGLHGMAIGNIIGTAAFNILIGIGIPAFLVTIPIDPVVLYFDAPYMILVYVLAILLVKYNGMKLTRVTGLFLVSLYILYVILRLFVFTG